MSVEPNLQGPPEVKRDMNSFANSSISHPVSYPTQITTHVSPPQVAVRHATFVAGQYGNPFSAFPPIPPRMPLGIFVAKELYKFQMLFVFRFENKETNEQRMHMFSLIKNHFQVTLRDRVFTQDEYEFVHSKVKHICNTLIKMDDDFEKFSKKPPGIFNNRIKQAIDLVTSDFNTLMQIK